MNTISSKKDLRDKHFKSIQIASKFLGHKETDSDKKTTGRTQISRLFPFILPLLSPTPLPLLHDVTPTSKE